MKEKKPTFLSGDRNQLVNEFANRGFTKGAEIGVAKGVFAEQLLNEVPGLHLYCIDSWTVDGENDSQKYQDRYYRQTVEKLENYKADIIRATSLEAAKDFKEDELDFIHIDASHDFDNVLQDIIAWAPKVRIGGIVSGHDFVKQNISHTIKYGVIEAVTAYATAHHVSEWFVNTGHRNGTWWWVKEHNL